jgi:hypothetical protein
MNAKPLANLLRPSKRKVLVFLLLFFCVVFYLPTVRCLEEQDVKEKICTKYQKCSTDIYFTLAKVLSSYEQDTFNCPLKAIGLGTAILLLLIAAASTYLIAGLADAYYARFRDL